MPHPDQAGVAIDQEARIREIQAKPYWDYGEVAIMLNVEVKTIRNMKWKREITFTKFGRKVYFPRDLIMKELRGNMVLCPATAVKKDSPPSGSGVA
jgi:excisionase family DNA binding protein